MGRQLLETLRIPTALQAVGLFRFRYVGVACCCWRGSHTLACAENLSPPRPPSAGISVGGDPWYDINVVADASSTQSDRLERFMREGRSESRPAHARCYGVGHGRRYAHKSIVCHGPLAEPDCCLLVACSSPVMVRQHSLLLDPSGIRRCTPQFGSLRICATTTLEDSVVLHKTCPSPQMKSS